MVAQDQSEIDARAYCARISADPDELVGGVLSEGSGLAIGGWVAVPKREWVKRPRWQWYRGASEEAHRRPK